MRLSPLGLHGAMAGPQGMPAVVEVAQASKSNIGALWAPAHHIADAELQAKNTALRAVACTSELVLTCSSRPVVKTYQITESKLTEKDRLKRGAVGATCVEASVSNPNVVATCHDDGVIVLWDLRKEKDEKGEEKFVKPPQPLDSTIDVAWKVKFCYNDRKLVSGGPKGNLAIWDLRKPGLEREVEPDRSSQVDTTSEHGSLPSKRSRVDDSTSVRSVRRGPEGDAEKALSPIFSLAADPSGRFIGCGRANGSLGIFRIDTMDFTPDIFAHHGEGLVPVRGLAFDASGKLLLSGGDDNHVCVLNAAAWARRRTSEEAKVPQIERFPAHSGWVTSISIGPDAQHRVALTTSWDGTVKLWDYGTHALLGQFKEHHDSVWDCAFSPRPAEASFFATVGADAVLALYVAKDSAAK